MQYLPNLRGLVDAKVEQEITKAFTNMYNYFDEELKKLESRATSTATSTLREQLNLFAARLATPLIEPTGSELATVQQETNLAVADIPNLPAAKITSGTFPLARIATNVLKTDDALNVNVTGAPNVNTGKVIIKDNAGNSVTIMTCA